MTGNLRCNKMGDSMSPCLPGQTTLLCALVGPLVLQLLALTCGSCAINALVRFVEERISTDQMMVLRQQYKPVDLGESSLRFEMT